MSLVGDLGNHISYVQRIGKKTWDYFDKEPAVTGKIVEKDVIAFVAPHEIVDEVVGDELHIANELWQFFLVFKNQVDFIKADDGTG